MVKFELGNPQDIERLVSLSFAHGKFVFRRDDSLYRLFMGEFNSHPDLVANLGLLKARESAYQHIWGGGDFEVNNLTLKFYGSSSTYGSVPNSFLIDCCRHVSIPRINQLVFALTPYSLEDPLLKEKRETWKKIGGYALDTKRTEYAFDGNMKPLRKVKQS